LLPAGSSATARAATGSSVRSSEGGDALQYRVPGYRDSWTRTRRRWRSGSSKHVGLFSQFAMMKFRRTERSSGQLTFQRTSIEPSS
jgi:hypothetical protein